MSHVHEGPLATYNSLTDSHLAGYFANNRMRRHLRKAGLVSKRGEIVSESTYRLNMSRREHKKHVKDMLAQAIVHKSLDMERARQGEIKKKLEEIAKMQLVRRVRASTNRKGDEDILPLLTPRSGGRSPSPSSKRRGRKYRPNGMPGVRRSQSKLSDVSLEEDGDVLYLDDEGYPITPGLSDQRNPEQNHIDTRHLHSLDSAALRKYAALMAQMEEGRGISSPYMMPQVRLPPRPPMSPRTPRSTRSTRRVQSASPRRVVTTDSRLACLHRPETAKSHAGDQQTMCRVAMKYHGWALNLAREKIDNTQEVVIEQQHCGGNTLTVFKERLEPGTKFVFISYRHRGYPFSLSLYVDGQMDSRVSTCCEYRHSRGAKIGGKQGHFSLIRVSGTVPCYKCQVAKGVATPGRAKPRKLKRPAEVRREEVIVVSTQKDKKETQAEEDVDRSQLEEEEEEDDVVMVPVERDETDSKPTSAQQEEDYADDFDDSQDSSKSPSSSSSSESESETETEPSTPKEEGKKREIKEEHFQPVEDRGEEREEREQTPTPTASPRSPHSRDTSARSPHVEVNGTGREIDDYSSDDETDEKNKVVSVEDVEAENTPLKPRRDSFSSSSDNTTPRNQHDRGHQDPAIISVDLLDKEEKEQEDARKERERRDEIRQKSEKEYLQQQQAERERRREEKKKAEEERRQEDLLRHQQRDEERRKREQQRQHDIEKERQRREEEEENRRQAAQVENDPEARELERMRSQILREQQILEEQQRREEKRKEEEHERERKWEQEEERRETKRKRDAEERERRRQEEGSSSARTESSTTRTSTSSSITPSSSAQSTPRHAPPPQLEIPQEEPEVTRPYSPLPSPAVYEKRHRGRSSHENAPPPRAVSPLPPAAEYEDRCRLREQERESAPARPISPLPPPAMYIKKERQQAISSPPVPRIGLDSATPTPDAKGDQPSTGRSSTTITTEDSSGDDDSDNTSTASLEEDFIANQKSRKPDIWVSRHDSDDDMLTRKRLEDMSSSEPDTPRGQRPLQEGMRH